MSLEIKRYRIKITSETINPCNKNRGERPHIAYSPSSRTPRGDGYGEEGPEPIPSTEEAGEVGEVGEGADDRADK